MNGLEISIISLAGTDARLEEYDVRMAQVIRAGLEKLGVDAAISFMDLSVAKNKAPKEILDQIFPIYRDKGSAISPAYFLNGELISYGCIPSLDEFIRSITDRFDFVDEEELDA